jgi:hypothetical protein
MGETFQNQKCLWDFSPYGKNNPIGFFIPWDFHGTAYGSENPTKSHGVLCFKVRYLKNYNQYRCTF